MNQQSSSLQRTPLHDSTTAGGRVQGFGRSTLAGVVVGDDPSPLFPACNAHVRATLNAASIAYAVCLAIHNERDHGFAALAADCCACVVADNMTGKVWQ